MPGLTILALAFPFVCNLGHRVSFGKPLRLSMQAITDPAPKFPDHTFV